MGHYYYGELTRKIIKYISDNIGSWKSQINHGVEPKINSWVDFFMRRDVHMVGFSMDLSEFDLWWLVCCKKRHFSNSKIYFYEPVWKKNDNSHNKILMEIYGVEICYIDCKENDFKDFYLRFIEKFSSHNL